MRVLVAYLYVELGVSAERAIYMPLVAHLLKRKGVNGEEEALVFRYGILMNDSSIPSVEDALTPKETVLTIHSPTESRPVSSAIIFASGA